MLLARPVQLRQARHPRPDAHAPLHVRIVPAAVRAGRLPRRRDPRHSRAVPAGAPEPALGRFVMRVNSGLIADRAAASSPTRCSSSSSRCRRSSICFARRTSSRRFEARPTKNHERLRPVERTEATEANGFTQRNRETECSGSTRGLRSRPHPTERGRERVVPNPLRLVHGRALRHVCGATRRASNSQTESVVLRCSVLCVNPLPP